MLDTLVAMAGRMALPVKIGGKNGAQAPFPDGNQLQLAAPLSTQTAALPGSSPGPVLGLPLAAIVVGEITAVVGHPASHPSCTWLISFH